MSDDLIQYGLNLGLRIRVNTKYWAEQVGLPFHPTHIQELNQFERRHSYSDMLKYPRDYGIHWTLWTSGTTRILLRGDPEYVRRFAGTLHLGGTDQGEQIRMVAPLAHAPIQFRCKLNLAEGSLGYQRSAAVLNGRDRP